MFEADAYYLKLLVAVDPKSEVAPRLVKYLVNNRKPLWYDTLCFQVGKAPFGRQAI